MQLTSAGQRLKAKIEAGDGTIPLDITRVVTASGTSPDPLNLTNVINQQQTATITGRTVTGIRTSITVLLTNWGNPSGTEPPLTAGYPLSQWGMFAMDPDVGEILYRISQFDSPNYMPAASEMGITLNPTWNIITGNASDVIVQIDPAGLATMQSIFNSVEVSDTETPASGVRTHYRFMQDVPNYIPVVP